MDLLDNNSIASPSRNDFHADRGSGELPPRPEAELGDDPQPRKKQKRKGTSHLKAVPESLGLRELIKGDAEAYARSLDRSRPFTRDDLEAWGRDFLARIQQPEKYLGFAMVMIGNYFWKKQFLSVPFERRLLLLPHCLKHAEGCPADYDEFGLDCEKCGACSIADYKVRAEQLGYKVLVAEGSPIVLKIIVEGYVDGILGVACLNVLEKAIDKVLIAGVPSFAVPLHSGDCKNTTLDESWVWEVLEQYEPLEQRETRSYVSLMRTAADLFGSRFEQLLPRQRAATSGKSSKPLVLTEEVSYDWLANGGKRFRPFITLAAYDAAQGGKRLRGTGGSAEHPISDGVAKVAMAIEAFHKASLVHDDIQDDDLFRYGRETLHRTHGLGPAINIGDYLIGVGYRLLNEARRDIGAEAAGDIIDSMAQAHLRLCDGQGAEMAWQNSPDWEITPLDALQIYALKTSPAFEAALFAGLRMAGDIEPHRDRVSQFCRQLGVGFQILNDLKDWTGDDNNKLVAGQDALALRPTVMLALALQAANAEQKQELRRIYESDESNSLRLAKLRRLMVGLNVFDKAEALVEKCRSRAETLADELENDEVRQLFYFLVDTVLQEEGEPTNYERMQGQGEMLMSLPLLSPAIH